MASQLTTRSPIVDIERSYSYRDNISLERIAVTLTRAQLVKVKATAPRQGQELFYDEDKPTSWTNR